MTKTIKSDKLSITADFDELLEKAKSSASGFEENRFCQYGDIPENGDPFLTEEEFNTNASKFIEDIKSFNDENKLRHIIDQWPRKKDGSFNKRHVEYLCESGNTEYICEWHNTWIYPTVKVVASSDTKLNIEYYTKTDTPG